MGVVLQDGESSGDGRAAATRMDSSLLNCTLANAYDGTFCAVHFTTVKNKI